MAIAYVERFLPTWRLNDLCFFPLLPGNFRAAQNFFWAAEGKNVNFRAAEGKKLIFYFFSPLFGST